MQAIPVVCLTGHLGAGKTSLLNHVLRASSARLGVIVNDFGELNVDAMLVSGQIDEPASIAGGCICCLPDDGEIDLALRKLADPRLKLDAIVVETSGLADPVAVIRLLGFRDVAGVRFGGLVDVVDAATHFETIDVGDMVPARYGAASLVVVNKLDRLPDTQRSATLERVEQRVRTRNPRATVVGAISGRIDPALLFDAVRPDEATGQLSLRELLIEAADDAHDHVHADSASVTSVGDIDAGALLDLLEDPPPGVYRIKGAVTIRERRTSTTYAVNVVGTAVDVAVAPPGMPANCLVAIGMQLDVDAVRDRLAQALQPGSQRLTADLGRRLRRHLR